MEWLQSADRWLFLLINQSGWPWLDGAMIALSAKWMAIPLYAIVLYLLWREFGAKAIWPISACILAVILSDQGSVLLFKNVFQRLRPCHASDLVEIVRLPSGHCGGQYGFVSSHASNVFAFLVLIGSLFRKHVWLLLLVTFWALAVCYSRIYLGAHYPLDVFVGAIWGSMAGFSVSKMMFRLNPTLKIDA